MASVVKELAASLARTFFQAPFQRFKYFCIIQLAFELYKIEEDRC